MTLKVTVAVWNLLNLHQALFLRKFGLHSFAVSTAHLVHSAHNSDHKSNPIQRVVTGAGIWWHVSATLFFSATTHYFFKKYCVVASLSQHINFLVTTHYFFKRYCVVPHVRNTIFFEKIMYSDSTSNVLWQTCNNNIFEKIMCYDKLNLPQHYFLKKYCVADMAHNNIFWKIMCCGSKSNVLWQTCQNTF